MLTTEQITAALQKLHRVLSARSGVGGTKVVAASQAISERDPQWRALLVEAAAEFQAAAFLLRELVAELEERS